MLASTLRCCHTRELTDTTAQQIHAVRATPKTTTTTTSTSNISQRNSHDKCGHRGTRTNTNHQHTSEQRTREGAWLSRTRRRRVGGIGRYRSCSEHHKATARSLARKRRPKNRPPTHISQTTSTSSTPPLSPEQRSIVRAGVRSAAPTFSNVIVAQRVKARGKRIEHSATGAQKPAPRVGSKSPRLACPPNATISCSKRNPRAYGAHAPSYPCFPPFRFFSPAPLLTHNRSLARALVRSLDRARFDRA